MRYLIRGSFSILALFLVLLSTGCGDDGTGVGGGVVLPPVVSLDAAQGFISVDTDLDLAVPSFRVRVTGNDGDADLRSLRIEENGVNVAGAAVDHYGFSHGE